MIRSKCRSICVTKDSKLVRARINHNHLGHSERIAKRPQYESEEQLIKVYVSNERNS